jgi:hypothetical protein
LTAGRAHAERDRGNSCQLRHHRFCEHAAQHTDTNSTESLMC